MTCLKIISIRITKRLTKVFSQIIPECSEVRTTALNSGSFGMGYRLEFLDKTNIWTYELKYKFYDCLINHKFTTEFINSSKIPATKFDNDVAMISGFSTNILENILTIENYTPNNIIYDKYDICRIPRRNNL